MSAVDLADGSAGAFREQLRIGAPIAVRGGARVTLIEQGEAEAGGAQWQSLTRTVSDEEIAEAGLLQARTVEIVERADQPVIARDVHVREELVVTRSISDRVAGIDEVVRHTEVEIEELPRSRDIELGEVARTLRQEEPGAPRG